MTGLKGIWYMASNLHARNWFALRNTTSWSLALLWSLYFRNLFAFGVRLISLIFQQVLLHAAVLVGMKPRSAWTGNYSCGCVVATSFIFSQTSGSSFDVNINRLLGTCMGLAVGNFPALLMLGRHQLHRCMWAVPGFLVDCFLFLCLAT